MQLTYNIELKQLNMIYVTYLQHVLSNKNDTVSKYYSRFCNFYWKSQSELSKIFKVVIDVIKIVILKVKYLYGNDIIFYIASLIIDNAQLGTHFLMFYELNRMVSNANTTKMVN